MHGKFRPPAPTVNSNNMWKKSPNDSTPSTFIPIFHTLRLNHTLLIICYLPIYSFLWHTNCSFTIRENEQHSIN